MKPANFRSRNRLVTAALVLGCLAWPPAPLAGQVEAEPGQAEVDLGPVQPELGDVQPVPRESIQRAIALEREKGYDLTAVTNGGRMWGSTLLQLAAWAQEAAPDGPPLFVNEADYFYGYLAATGLPEDQAPEFVRISHEYGQHTLVEYRMDRVVDLDETEAVPVRALAVRTWWPESADLGDKYTYEDTLSDPSLLVENRQETGYRLLDFGDVMLFDEMEGIRGRPTSGFLGALFQVIGTGRLVWSRMAVADDGLLLVRAQAKKLISKTTTVVVTPEGTGTELPEDRADLTRLAQRLEEPLDVAYLPWPF